MPQQHQVQQLDDPDDIVQLLERLIARLQRGEPFKATLRVTHRDGTVQVVDIGYDTEEEKDAAMAKLLKVLGELH